MAETHVVRVRAAANLPRPAHVVTRTAAVAADPVEETAEVRTIIVNRIIDNAAVAATAR